MPLGGGREFVVRARGLPWSVTDDEVAEFFEPEVVLRTREQIHRHEVKGRFSGEVYLELYTKEEEAAALAKNRFKLGKRYIEVFACKPEEMDVALENSSKQSEDALRDDIVKLRGLPFHVTKEEIRSFLEGCELKADAQGGIHFVPDRMGRGSCNGEAFVEFADPTSTDRALAKNKETIGTRWIEVFRCTRDEMDSIMYPPPMGGAVPPPHGHGHHPMSAHDGARPTLFSDDLPFHPPRDGPYPRRPYPGGAGGPPPGYAPPRRVPGEPVFRLKVQGLPYEATRQEVVQFFHPAEVLFLEFIRDASGRVQDCFVEFSNDRDFQLALSRHKQYMGRRYIELIPMEGNDDVWYPPPPPPMDFYSAGGAPPPCAVKMRGVPYDTTSDEVYTFFKGLHIVHVDLLRDRSRKVQEVIVAFASPYDLEEAMKLNRQNIRHRYVELFEASPSEIAPPPPGPGPIRPGRGMHHQHPPYYSDRRPNYGGFN